MIDTIEVENFKSLRAVDLSLSRLNVLTGFNGSGKSSLLQSILLLRQSFSNVNKHVGLILRGGLVDLGSGKDVFYQVAGVDEKIRFAIRTNSTSVEWEFTYHATSDILPLVQMTTNVDLSTISTFNNNFQYLNAEHLSPQVSYNKSEYHVIQNQDIGTRGEYTAHYLAQYGLSKQITTPNLQHPNAKSLSFIHQVDAWVSEISPGAKLIAEDVRGLDIIRLAIQFETDDGYTEDIKPINTGFGITYVLPIVVAILKAKAGDFVILENPESHLHPRGQSTIGRMIAYAAQSGVQFLIETHSDHVINGIRVAVKKQQIHRQNVKIFHFDRITDGREQYSEVREILIDKNGELSDYPPGFLDEWREQLMALI